MDYYIFGAHSRGYTLLEYLRTLNPNNSIIGFLFNNSEKNPEEIEGIKVLFLRDSVNHYDLTASVYLATRGVYHESIINELKSIGFEHIIPITPELDTELRNKYVNMSFEAEGRRFYKIDAFGCEGNKKIEKKNKSNIYIAKTVFDSPFQMQVGLKEYESIIQVGSVLAVKRIPEAVFTDDTEDNISNRNHQFCELTALYWIWKHSNDEIVGLEHWRRRFILPNDWIERVRKNDIDVILPVPLCVMPSLLNNYKSRHDAFVWDKCMDILKKYHPEDYDSACSFFANRKLYSPCNMLITKREILAEYCEWLFPVLLEVNDIIGTLEDKYQNRYPGFLAERLLNYFFEKNRERLKIVYADKSFLS